jgi:hypothetical protein
MWSHKFAAYAGVSPAESALAGDGRNPESQVALDACFHGHD